MNILLRTGFGLGLWLAAVVASPAGIGNKSDAGQVGMVVAKLLEERHYNAQPVNDTLSRAMLRNYLDALDYNHLFFLQSDVAAFENKYAETLDDDLLLGNLQPAFEIYEVYSNRLEQTVATIKELVQQDYTFDGDDVLSLDRHELPWAAHAREWRELLRQRVKFELLEERLNKEKPEDAVKTIIRRYDRLLRSLHENDLDTVADLYLNALARLFDPHTQYLPPASFDNFSIDMRLSLSGIGAVLTSEDGYAKITSIVPGGPADLDKRLKVNDRVVAVAQGDSAFADVVDMKLNKVVEQIRGKKGTTVRLRVIPADAPDSSTRIEIALVRDEIKLTEQEAKAKLIEKPTPDNGTLRLGYIELPSFYVDMKRGADAKSSTRDVQRLLQKLTAEKIDGLVLDLRRNSGGSLPEAIALTGLFIPEGPVVQIKDPQGRINLGQDTDHRVAYEGPLVVLVSHLSASASEILAAALQDYGRAVVVGDRSTFGKGTVQQMVELGPVMPYKRSDGSSPGALKLTIQKFYRVSGGSTQSRGVRADIELPSALDPDKIGESSLPKSLPYDEVLPASITKWSRRPPPVAELQRASRARVAADPEFRYITEDAERLRKKSAEKTISLNEARRLAERQETEARQAARKAERESRTFPPLPTTEISLAALEGTTNTVARLTREVMTEAAKNSQPARGGRANGVTAAGEAPGKTEKPAPDPYFDESLNVLADYIQLLGSVHAQK
jgi:carboxyl-terminal processing protease